MELFLALEEEVKICVMLERIIFILSRENELYQSSTRRRIINLGHETTLNGDFFVKHSTQQLRNRSFHL